MVTVLGCVSIEVSWTEDEAHPQTCVTCHDPHASGTTSGSDPNATVRISGDTPPLIAGFTATDVGRGAICMTCHNTRRGLRNDAVYDQLFKFDCTKRHFVPRQHGYNGDVPENIEDLALDHEQIQFRKQHLGKYLERLVTKP